MLLKHLARLIEQHHSHSLWILAYGEGSEGGKGHEHILVEHVAAQCMSGSLARHSPPHRQESHDIPQQRRNNLSPFHTSAEG